MLEQLRARGALHRLSEIELLLKNSLRVLLVEEGIWLPGDALDRLVLVDFSSRARRLSDLAPLLYDECLDRALDMASRPGWADDARWKADEELIQTLSSRRACLANDEQLSESIQAAGAAPGDPESIQAAESIRDTLASNLFRTQATGRDLWSEPWFGRMLSYVEDDNLWPEDLALVAELARDRADPRSADLRRALLTNGHELWAEAWFRRVFDAEERKEHLQRVVTRHESTTEPWYDSFRGLLQVARRLQGAPRTTVLRWAVAEREKGRSSEMTVDLAHVAALTEGQERAAVVAEIEARFDEADSYDRLVTLAALMPGATAAEAIDLVRRGLEWIAAGQARCSNVEDFLAAIPSSAWAGIGRMGWEPALIAGGPDWDSYELRLIAVPNLPEEARRLHEELGLPTLLGRPAHERLETGAKIVHALSPAGRVQLIASVLALDAATWRETSSAVGRIARALDDDDLERVCRTLDDPDPKGKWWAERGLAEAWAARGRLDLATSIVERITDDEGRAEAQVAVAVVAGEAAALLPRLDPRAVQRVLHQPNGLLRWTPQERGPGPAFGDALAVRLEDGSSASAYLKVCAALWPTLSASTRAELAPRIERAVEAVLASDDLRDDSLCAICEFLPERLLERIWIARASASAYRHVLSIQDDNRFCEFMLAGDHRHHCVLHIIQTFGGDETLLEHARWLAGISPGSSEDATRGRGASA